MTGDAIVTSGRVVKTSDVHRLACPSPENVAKKAEYVASRILPHYYNTLA